MGYSSQGRKELDMTKRLHFHFHFFSVNVKTKERFKKKL